MSARGPVVNISDCEEKTHLHGDRWGGHYKQLTPSMRPSGGSLGVNCTRVPPGRSCVPFHSHLREDEAFYILSGTGVLRYGNDLYTVGVGDCISCPAGSGKAHQLANTGDDDLVYLAIGAFDPHEVCEYPDNGKVLVRGVGKIGRIETAPYMDGEPETPTIFDLIDSGA